VYYHYHTKGIDDFVSQSIVHLILTRFFLRNVNVILLSRILVKDFEKANVYKKIFFLSNGIKNKIDESTMEENIKRKYENLNQIQVLYLSQLTKEKGFDEVLALASHTLGRNIHYHFAGGWQSYEDKDFFYKFVEKNNLTNSVTYHGFVSGIKKENLFNKVHLLAYPSRNDAFPLTILESLSYGVPVIASSQGSIPIMLDEKSGIVVNDLTNFIGGFEKSMTSLISQQAAKYCRERFVKEFTLEKFEINLIGVLND
jgi:glycosyltransferase involved in cell wall biosynthesis